MTMVNAYDSSAAVQIPADEKKLIEKREDLLGPAYRLFYAKPIHIVRGEGVWLFDPEGNAYLDAYNNVASVGHCHPHVVEALARQAAILNTHTRYLNETVVAYAERLLAKFPRELNHIMFTCTGSEANDLALRIAKSFTGRTGLIVTSNAYHGGTDTVAQISPSLGSFVNLGEHVRLVPAPDTFRSPPEKIGEVFAEGVRAAIADLRRHGIETAALIVDTIFSSDGVFVDPAGFLRDAVAAVRETGGIFIADEVQPGFGRTGDTFWGFQRHGLVPDMVTVGKPMGNGHPIAGLIVRHNIVENFGKRSRYFNTFGGNPVSCAVGMAVLDVLERENLQQSAKDVGAYFKDGLTAMAKRHPCLADIRGVGLFIGVEIVSDSPQEPADLAARIVNEMRERRVLISATGPRGNILKIRPPLVFSRANVDLFLENLDGVLNGLRE
ncbi:MAG TPA: aminotransferase class III-fold pyridoxal phosphate-dependent enzyme [Rhizomicrobium sp.]|nr:aminotransferase class III-fold pyridoxal phosphate-dependent enzyme [Rhizomicrobium sp.]